MLKQKVAVHGMFLLLIKTQKKSILNNV